MPSLGKVDGFVDVYAGVEYIGSFVQGPWSSRTARRYGGSCSRECEYEVEDGSWGLRAEVYLRL
jgi:hypothetical protein